MPTDDRDDMSKPTLLGRPLVENPDLPEVGEIVFGDLGPDWKKWLLERTCFR